MTGSNLDLSGLWRAVVADEAARRAFPDPDYDDSAWAEIAVPGHWRSTAAFAASDGPLLYRTPFAARAPVGDRRSWLVLDGLFYQGDVWLDGAYLGDTEGYFFPHEFEVTAALRDRHNDHLLAVEVTCTPQTDRTAKRNLTGVFQHWDCLDPDWNPGGVWQPVRLEETGPVRITSLRVLCQEATAERAVVGVHAVLDAADAGTVELRTTVGDRAQLTEERAVAAGLNELSWQVTVDRPDLWWPHALGEPALTTVIVEANLRGGTSHRRRLRTGLRQVRMKDWILSVNGERLFLKGANHGPTRMALAEATAEDLEGDVVLAKEAGLDLLRIHGHVTRRELYDAADRHGMLLWQDLPLQWGYARGIRKQAARQAREAVDLLGHHPSIAMWCGHNEPLALAVEPGGDDEGTSRRRHGRYLALQELPTWNKTILDASVRRALERSDGSRPVVAHSGVLPHPGSGGTDTHLYLGWYHGHERDLPTWCARFPRLARFVGEFGAQAVPSDSAFIDAGAWPHLDWDRLARTHGLQRAAFDRYVPPDRFATFAAWREATQQYQATLLRHHIETLRRLKYRPTGGFCQFLLADAYPAVSCAVLDHERAPKQGFDALVAACAPVIIVADRPAPAYAPGDAIALDVHVVNDLRAAVDGATATARLSWAGGEHTWSWEGGVPADACVRVGTVQAVVRDVTGDLRLDLTLEAAAVKVTNSYASVIGMDR